MKRTDIHSPSNLKPENYEVIEYIYTLPPKIEALLFYVPAFVAATESWRKEREYWQGQLKKRGANIHPGWSNCDHCGAWYNHGVILEHRDTKELVTVGWQCAENRFSLTNVEHKRKQTERVLKAIRHRAGTRARLRTFYREHREILRALNANHRLPGNFPNDFLIDLRIQLKSDGTLTPNQIAAVEKPWKWTQERYTRYLERKAAEANEPTRDAPEGRVEIEGEIVHTKLQYGDCYNQWKMLVKADGYKVWSTVPAAILEVEVGNSHDSVAKLRGKRVKFTATLKRSDKDASFAFAKRPTKAELI